METNQILNSKAVELVGGMFKEYRKDVFRLFYERLGGDKEASRDMTSEVFLKALLAVSSGKYDDRGQPRAWIIGVARNHFVDKFRRNKKTRTYGLDVEQYSVEDPHLDWASIQSNLEISNDLHALVKRLPEEQKEVLLERIYFGTPFKVIAQKSGISINTCIGRMRYALINLRRLVKEKGLDLSGFKSEQ